MGDALAAVQKKGERVMRGDREFPSVAAARWLGWYLVYGSG
jgi:hypothetical protein